MFIENSWIGRDIKFQNKDRDYKLDLYEQCLLPNESLYRGYLDISLIESRFSTFNVIKNVILSQDYTLEEFAVDNNKLSIKHHDLYFLGKICYLTKKYIEDKKFNHPITVYFNPRIEKNIVHPGIGRLEVYKILNINSVHCLYFNTGGSSLESIGIANRDNFEKITLRELLAEEVPFMLCYSLDHGSLIPQIHFENFEKEDIYNYVKNIGSLVRNLKIKTNIHIDFLEPFIDNDNYNIELIFSNSFTELDIARSIIFSLIKHNYQSDNLIIKVNTHG